MFLFLSTAYLVGLFSSPLWLVKKKETKEKLDGKRKNGGVSRTVRTQVWHQKHAHVSYWPSGLPKGARIESSG